MIRTPLRRLVTLATSAVAVAAALALTVPAQASTAPSCGITWGSLAKQGPTTLPVAGAALADVRAGRQACFDRLVLDVRGPAAVGTWRAQYVAQVTEDPSGRPVPLRGGAFLQISVGAADLGTYTAADRRELVDVAGFTTFRQVASAGSFEGVSSLGLGVRARLPFRVFTLPGIPGSAQGTRVVVDVAHRW